MNSKGTKRAHSSQPGAKSRGRAWTELSRKRTRSESSKFFQTFSATQLNATLLIILAATFLIDGMALILNSLGEIQLIHGWLVLVLLAMTALIVSVILISLDNIVLPLRLKRILNVASYSAFLLGVTVFLVNLVYLVFIFI